MKKQVDLSQWYTVFGWLAVLAMFVCVFFGGGASLNYIIAHIGEL